jgi:hypothetical protein
MTLILDDRSVSAQHWAESGQERLAVSIEDPDHLGVVRLSGQQDAVVDLLRRMLEAAEAAPVAEDQQERWLEAWHRYHAWREHWGLKYANRRGHDPWWEGWWEDRKHVHAWCWVLFSRRFEAVVCGDRALALAVGEGIKALDPERAWAWWMIENSGALRQRHAWDWPYDVAGQKNVSSPEQIEWRRSECQ